MFKKTFTALTVMAALGGSALLPASALAGEKDKNKVKHGRALGHDKQERRIYDRAHRDYHAWNGDEDRLFREFLTERHRPVIAFSRLNRKQQHAYWQWRHDHR